MDREEAIELLKGKREGVVEWNRRRESGEIIPDLRRAYLNGADLREAHLRWASLVRARLDRAELSGANRSQELRHQAMQEEYESLPSVAGLRPKIRRFIRRLMRRGA
jgi:hypothetical protein